MGEMTEFSYEQHGAWNGVLEEDLAFVVFGRDLGCRVDAVKGDEE